MKNDMEWSIDDFIRISIWKLDDFELIGGDRRKAVSLQFIPEQPAFVVSGFESPSIFAGGKVCHG